MHGDATAGKNMRDDISFIMIGHAEQSTDQCNRRLKTVGKLVDNVITWKACLLLFCLLMCLLALVTVNTLLHSLMALQCKPRDMFEFKIDNDSMS